MVRNLYCFAARADKSKDTLYTDATGALPVRFIDGNPYYYVASNYDTTYVHVVVPVNDRTDTIIIKTFDSIFEDMEKKGNTPWLNTTDNHAVAPLKRYLEQKDSKWQFSEQSNHQVNATEWAIQTLKTKSSADCA
jgi:hypothetical protein